jgi:hypothetical protein
MFGITVLGLRYGSRQRRRASTRRAFERRATTLVAGLREGKPAKVRGTVSAREPLVTSRIGEHPCIGYNDIIDDVDHDPQYIWTPLVSREAWPSFLVTDETGSIAVEGKVKVLVDASENGTDLNSRAYALLAEDGVRMRDLTGPREFWFRETLLKVGDRVSVIGRPSLTIDPAGRGSFRDPPRLFVMRGTSREPVVVIDDDEPAGDQPA